MSLRLEASVTQLVSVDIEFVSRGGRVGLLATTRLWKPDGYLCSHKEVHRPQQTDELFVSPTVFISCSVD